MPNWRSIKAHSTAHLHRSTNNNAPGYYSRRSALLENGYMAIENDRIKEGTIGSNRLLQGQVMGSSL